MMTEKCDAFGRVTHCDTFLQELFLCFSRWWFSRKKASQCVTDGKASRLLSRSSSPYTSGGVYCTHMRGDGGKHDREQMETCIHGVRRKHDRESHEIGQL
jgi:hypothetical protein